MASLAQTRFPNPPSASSLETVSGLFEDGIRSCPEGTAIQFECSRRVSYQELGGMVNFMVSKLHGTVRRGQLVPVLLPRSIQQVCVILAIAKLGAVYVPLDAGIPDTRLCSIVSFVGGWLVVTENESKHRFREVNGVKLEYFDPFDCLEEPLEQRARLLVPATETVHPCDLAAVLFTSGSTGRPKGVMLSHRNLIEPVRLLSRMESISPTSRILQFARCAFDVHLLDILCAVFNGAVLCQVSHDKLTSNLPEWIDKMAVNVVHLTPSVISFLDCHVTTSLKYMVTCGEPVTKAIIRDWSSKVVLINLYGPCEASSIIATVLHLDSEPSLLGKASPHASIHVLDGSGHSVAAGIEGEIYASGDSVALGYLNDKTGTSKSFHLAASFDSALNLKGAIMYATGDHGKLTEAGELIFHGRRDSEVKINGQRVDLTEIRTVLAEFPIQSFVLPIKDSTGQMRIYGFVSREKSYSRLTAALVDDSTLVKELYSTCRAMLPSYMIPKLVVLSAIPLNPSGKVDERGLSETIKASFHSNPDGVTHPIGSAISTAVGLDDLLATIVAARFFGNKPSIKDNLKHYGLTSLDFMGFIKDIQTTLGISLTLGQVFRNPDLRSIAKIVKEKLSQSPTKYSPSFSRPADQNLVKAAREHEFQWIKASAGQQSIFTAQNILRNHAYNCNFVLHIESFPLNPERLISALEFVCSRHESLRSTYHVHEELQDSQGTACWQKIHPVSQLGPSCRVACIDTVCSGQNIGEILTLIEVDAVSIFDLGRESPVRMTVYRVSSSNEEWIIHFNIHHIAIDEWSFAVICRELELIYRALQLDDAPASFLAEPPQFRELSLHDQVREAHDQRKDRLTWWLRVIDKETCESLTSELLTQRPDETFTRLENDESLVQNTVLDSKQVRFFEANNCAGSTAFIGWLTLCEIVLARMTQRTKFALQVPVTERGMDPRFQDVVGFCLNTLLIPVELTGKDTFESILRSTQQTYDACIANTLPFEIVAKALNNNGPEPRKVRPDITFVYHDSDQTFSISRSPLGFLQSAKRMQLTQTGSRFALAIHYSKKSLDDKAQLTFEFRRSLFSRPFVEAMARSFEAALSDVVARGIQKPYIQINCLSVVDDALIAEWSLPPPLSEWLNKTWILGDGVLLHQLVESVASRHPQVTAIVTKPNCAVTYGELVAKAQTLLRQMQESGLKRRMIVFLLLHKSPQLVVAQLAVLMGGSIFAVLDPLHDLAVNQAKIGVSSPGMVVFNSTTQPDLYSLRLSGNVRSFDISETRDEVCTQAGVTPCVTDGAYLCFAWASTRNAKCSSVSHAAAATSIMSSVERFKICPGDRVAMLSSTTCKSSILETFATLAAGATLCITSEGEVLADLAHTLMALKVSHVFATPTLISLLDGPAQAPSLRFLCLGGEPATANLLRLWAGSVDLRQAYGPAEAAINTHSSKISATDDMPRVVQRIGRSLPYLRSFILDVHGNLAIPGTVNHLYIGASQPGKLDHLIQGFILPESAVYTDHPRFGRLYITEDLAFYTFDGELHLLGRQDNHVKLHGLEMNVSQIERSIQSGTDRRVVVLLCDASGSSKSDQVLVLFVHFSTPDSMAQPEQCDLPCPWLLPLDANTLEALRELRLHAAERLPDVMVPQFWLPIRALPRSDDGRTDHKALNSWADEFLSYSKKVDYATLSPSRDRLSSFERIQQTALGQTLTKTWKTVFGLCEDRVNADTTFLHAGGDSISAIRYVSSLRTRGVAGVTISMLYESPTLVQLHDALTPLQSPRHRFQINDASPRVDDIYRNLEPRHARHDVADHIEREMKTLGISKTAFRLVYPATSMQRTMLLQAESNPTLYITQAIFSVCGELSTVHMAAAWRAVCDAHPAMNTTFARILYNDELLYFSVELAPSTLSEPARIIKDTGSTDASENQLKVDLERGFRVGGSMFRLVIMEDTEQSHKMILSCHHAICDGWSLNIILRDLASAYQGHRVRPTRSFSEAVDYDRKRDKSVAKSYWQTYLQEYSSTPLIWGNSRGNRPTDMRLMSQVITSVSESSLARFAQECDVTPAVSLMAAWAILLSNAVGRDDVAFGVVVSGRNVPVDGAIEMVGNFLNTVPLRITVDRYLACDVWLQGVHQSSIESLEHHHLPLEDIIRQSDCAQIFETLVVFENQAGRLGPSAFGSLHLEAIEGREFSEVPLTLVLQFIENGLMITFKFNSSAFPAWRIESMARTYAAILLDILARSPMANLGRSEPYEELTSARDSAAQLQKQLQNTNDDTLVSLFAKAAQVFPEQRAVETENNFVTFSELSHKSNAMRDFLLHAGVSSGEIVPVVFGHSIDMVIAMVGILKVGAAYCPVDVESPAARVRHVVEKVAARVIIGDQSYREKLSDAVHVEFGFLSVEEILRARVSPEARAEAGLLVTPQHKCYVFFTSGSTGRPKGCVLTHSAVVNAVLQTSAKTQISSDSRVLLYANYIFDASVIDIFGCLATGGTLCLSARARLLSSLDLVIRERQINHVHLTPSVAQVLSPNACPSLRALVLGGEKLPLALRDRWAHRVKLYDGYGLTECAVQVSTTLVSSTADVSVISDPLPRNLILLLDSQGKIPRVGEIGEIYIGGQQVFSGYLDAPEAAQRVQRYCPVSGRPLFATGDLGIYRPDMTIQFLGREDTQVKLSGERIEIEEIESVILSLEAVERCAVLVERNQLHAIVQVAGVAFGQNSDRITERCLSCLPRRLLPVVHLWPQLPLSSSSKLDRRATMQKFRETERLNKIPSENAPNSAFEHAIASIIAKISGHRPKDATLELHHCGLNSMDILQVRSAMAERYGFVLGLSEFLLAGSIRNLARLVEENIALSRGSPIEAAASTVLDDCLPATDPQLTIWMAQQRYSDSTYNVGRVLRFRDVDSGRLYASLRAVAQSLDTFRITFEWDSNMGCLRQRLHPEPNISVRLYKLEDCDDVEALVRKVCGEDFKTIFDLEKGPLARFHVFIPSPEECYLFYNIHHILVDEWVCEKFIEAIFKEYLGRPWGDIMDSSWVSPTMTWDLQLHKDMVLEKWKVNLSGAATFDTTSWPQGSAEMNTRSASSTSVFKMPIQVLQQLRFKLRDKGPSLFVALLSAFQLMMHQYTTSTSLIILVPVSRRGFEIQSINAAGNMTHTAAVKSDIKTGDNFATFCERTAHSVVFAQEHSSVPVDRALGTISTTVSEHSVMFVYNKASALGSHISVSDLSRDMLPQTSTMFDLLLTVIEGINGLEICFTFNAKFAVDFMEKLAKSYQRFLERISRLGTEGTLRELIHFSTIGLEETETFPNVLMPKPPISSTLLHEAFEIRAALAPSAIAIDSIVNGRRTEVSYAELNGKASKLAETLQKSHGVVAGDIIPISIDQTPELLIAIIGILKAGAGYTPIPRDGTWPLERVCQILRRCQAKIMISDSAVVSDLNIEILDIRSQVSTTKWNRSPKCLANHECIAYILWTSGTTGEPKGVMLSHRAAVSCISSIAGRLYPMSTKDRVFQFSSPVFDVSVADYFATLSTGATLCMMPRAELIGDVNRAVTELKPTTASLTPSVAQLLDAEAAHFQTLILSGEVVPQTLRDRFIREGTRLINGYGPTESNIVTYLKMNVSDDIRSIGKPLSSAPVAILDDFGNMVPTFVRGEICVGGPHLFSGYQSRDDLTESVHLVHEKYGRLYRTGDVGFFDATGNIIFCGRRDSQTKLRGHRVETEGISSVISEMVVVKASAVAVIEDRLIAFVVYGTSDNPNTATATAARVIPQQQHDMDEIRNHILARVPSASVPSLWLRISQVPLTISGKLNVRTLASLAKDAIAEEGEMHVGPDDHYERSIHDCCMQVFGVSVSITANMLHHGLDSYAAMALIPRLRRALPNFRPSFRDIITNPVPRRLAALARSRLYADDMTQSDPLDNPFADVEPSPYYPASSMQRRFCLAQQVFQDATYNVPGLFEVRDVAIEAVQAVLDAIVAEHAIFRTRFEFSFWEGYQQVIVDEFHINVAKYDFSTVSSSEASVRMQGVLRTELGQPFDITRLPLVRCKAFQKPDGLMSIFVNFHHSIIDEHSLYAFMTELSCKIHSLTLGGSPIVSRAARRMQYIDYCLQEKRKLGNATVIDKSTRFWKQHLQGIDAAALRVNTPGTHGPGTTVAGYKTRLLVSKDAFSWAQLQGMTSFSVYFAYFQIILARCWGCHEPTVLIPMSLRPTDCEELYGCFLNTVPVHVSINSSSSLESVIQSCNRILFDVIEYSFVPFEIILQAAGLEMEDFPLMFVYHEENARQADLLKDISSLAQNLSSNVKPKFPVTFSMTAKREDSGHLLRIEVDYDPNKVSATMVRSLCDHYGVLLNSAANAGKTAIVGELDILTQVDRDLLRRRQVQQAPDNIPRIHDIIEQRVRENPERTACWFEADVKVTYQNLWVMISGVSELLLPYSRRDGRVAIFMGPGTHRIASIVGTVRAGLAYIPLDVDWPVKRIAAVLLDSAPEVVLISSYELPKVRRVLNRALAGLTNVGPVISLPSRKHDDESNLIGSKMPSVDASYLAYIMYTSGSTGTPRGVKVEHGALSNSVEEHCRIYRLSAGSRLLQFAPWTFDVSVVDIFGTLSRGATLCLGSKDFLLSRLQEAVNLMEITHLATTPTIAALLSPERSPTLETLAIGGEPMTKTVQGVWSNTVRLLNVYGPTETTVNVVYCQMRPEYDVGVIGKPLRNVIAYILNDQLQEVPIGSIGQLAIGGAQLAREYNDKASTRASFPIHQDFGRIFLTGDLARFNNDGSIHCFGRSDNQVKLRGQRIELEEIERLIGTLPEIRSVVVSLLKTDQFEALCAGFSTWNGSGFESVSHVLLPDLQAKELISRLNNLAKTHIPHYAVPRYWMPLSNVPSDANGKLDRCWVRNAISALTTEELARFAVQQPISRIAGQPLESEKEKILGTCIAQVLGTRQIFKESNFFTLSGDSISAIRLCSLANHHGLRIVVSDIYQNPTLKQLASIARKTQASAAISGTKPEGVVYNTPIMEWFFSLKKRNPHWYSQTVAIKLKVIHDLKKLPSLWETIVRIHPSLRITLKAANQVEILDPSRSKDTFSIDWMRFASFDALLNSITDIASCLRLDTGPISSLALVQVAHEGYCVFCVHHLAIDTVSWQIIFDDLNLLLRGESILPEFVTFRDWSLHLRQQRLKQSQQHSSEDDRAAPRDHSHINLKLIPNFANKAHLNTAATARVVALQATKGLTNLLLTDASRKTGTEPVDLLLASLLLAFQRWKGIQEAEICFESHGRDLGDESLDVSRTVGWFTIITRILFPIPSSAIAELNELIAEVKARRGLAMAGMDKSEPLPGHLAHIPVVIFNYHGSYSTGHEDDLFVAVDIGQGRADEDPLDQRFAAIDIGCGINNGILTMSIIYSVAMYNGNEASDLLHQWSNCLKEVLEHCKSDTDKCILASPELPGLQLQRRQIVTLVQSSLEPVGIKSWMVENVVRATDIQKSMILASQEFGAYIESFTYRICGTLEVELLTASWSRVIAKHTSLRSVFIRCDVQDSELRGEILQVILTPEHSPLMLAAGSQVPRPPKLEYGKPTMQMYLYQNDDGSLQFIWHYHHALVDGWSAGIVLRDFQRAYVGHPGTATVPFERVRSSMRDSARDVVVTNFWKMQLEGLRPNRLMDHSQRPTFPDGSPRDWRYDQDLPYNLQDLHACAAAESTTISTILRAAWALTLAYFYGQEDVVFGATTSGRNIDVAGIEEVVGPCVNTVPCRILVRNSDSREIYLREVLLKCALLVENDTLSLHRIYEVSGKKDLFDTTFVYQNYAKFPPEPAMPFTLELMEAKETTDIPLNVMMSSNDSGRLHVSALLHGEHLSREYLENIFAAFTAALGWICSKDGANDIRIGDLTMLSPNAQRKVEDFSRGPTPEQPNVTVWQLFASQERQRSERTAIEFYMDECNETLSYGDLLRRAEHGAQYLHMKGIRSGDRVALYMDKSPATIAIMLSLLRLGAICIPIRFGSPDERIEVLMQEAIPRLVVLFEAYGGHFSLAWNILYMEDILSWLPSNCVSLPELSCQPDDPAMILFTSGTTGVPKGVIMPHRQVAGYADAMVKAYQYDWKSRIFSFANYSFDVIITDILGGLSAGAVLCFSNQEFTMNDLPRLLRASRSTHVNVTSSVASMLDPDKLPHLQNLVLTGEPATRTLFQTWASKIHVVNSYGPTEAGVITWFDVSPDSNLQCVGHVVAGMEVMVLDDSLRRVPIGTQGTIYTCGHQLSLGYLNQLKLTEQLFIANPYSPGKLMYNTGDLGAFDSQGNVLCFGRKDQQIKIHGQRVELEEIEAVLTHDKRIAVITVFNPTVNQTQLIAFFEVISAQVLGGTGPQYIGAGKMAWELEKRGRQKLPSYMVPSAFVPIHHLPITANGKIDRAKLETTFLDDYLPYVNRKHSHMQLHEQVSVTESKLRDAIAALFGIPGISIDTDLFGAGVLDSLSSMSLAAHLRTIFVRPVYLRWIIESRTIRDLACRIDSGNADEDALRRDQLTEQSLQIPPMISFSHSLGGRKVFCIHPSSGLSYPFQKLAKFLPEVNIIGINDPHFGDPEAYRDICDMANLHLKSVLELQAEGHFVLLGYSFGGHVATEMARLLHERRHTVQLVLIDPSVEPAALEKFKLPKVVSAVLKSVESVDEHGPRTAETEVFQQKLRQEIMRNLRLLTTYQMKYFPWQAVLLRASSGKDGEHVNNENMSNGYGPLVKNLRVEQLSGDHNQVFSEGYLSFNSSVIRKVLGYQLKFPPSSDSLEN